MEKRDKLIEERKSAKDVINLIVTTVVLSLLFGISLHPLIIIVAIVSSIYHIRKVSKLNKLIAEIDQANN